MLLLFYHSKPIVFLEIRGLLSIKKMRLCENLSLIYTAVWVTVHVYVFFSEAVVLDFCCIIGNYVENRIEF